MGCERGNGQGVQRLRIVDEETCQDRTRGQNSCQQPDQIRIFCKQGEDGRAGTQLREQNRAVAECHFRRFAGKGCLHEGRHDPLT